MKKKILSLLLATTMVSGISGTVNAATFRQPENTTKAFNIEKDQKSIILDQINRTIEKDKIKDNSSEELIELLVLSDGTDITDKLKNINADVDKKSTSVYVVKMPINRVKSIANITSVTSVGKDEIVPLPKLKPGNFNLDRSGLIYKPNLEYDHKLVGMSEFWRKGYNGKGIKVAVVDTGIEPANEMLTATPDGKIKIVDYQDFWKVKDTFSEGDVKLTEVDVKIEDGNKYVDSESGRINIPECLENKVLFGYFDETPLKYLNDYGKPVKHDVNNNGKFNDKFPVIVMNYADDDKSNDKIYVDTNLNYNLTEDKEMNIYKELVKSFKEQPIFKMDTNNNLLLENGNPVVKSEFEVNYSKLVNHFIYKSGSVTGNKPKGTSFNFVISDVEKRQLPNNKEKPYQWVVNLSYDGDGHGTHVAGDAVGNGYTKVSFMNTELKDSQNQPITDGTVKGAAPGAQVMALKVFGSNTGTADSIYMAAIEYACENGADVINMSLGSLPDINDESTPACKLINQLSQKYGAVFCNSAGNSGPCSNTVGSPATAEWSFTVGAYCANLINYECGTFNEDFLHAFSSRGPSEDGRIKPTIVSPGNMISAAPLWNEYEIRKESNGGGTYTHYQHMNGTSQAAPYAAGVLASLRQAIKENNIPYHPLVLKEAVFETGDKKVNDKIYKPSEIGGGLIKPSAAYDYLMNLKKSNLTQSELKYRDKDGNDIYIDRNAIVLKSEFAYTENLNYKPEGLYVRNREIPEKVCVKLTNTKNVDVNLNLTKDSYNYQNDWLILPENNISLKAKESKMLFLSINKNNLNPHINSALIRMDDPSTPLKEGFIPITITNYNDLTVNKPSITVYCPEGIKPGESKTELFRVPYGINKFKVSIKLTDPRDAGAYKIHVTNPLGVKFKAEDYARHNIDDTIYGKGILDATGINEFEIEKPIPGTWEFALEFAPTICTQLGINRLDRCPAKYSLTTSLDGVIFEPTEINYNGYIGEYKQQTIDLKVANSAGNKNRKILLKSTTFINENIEPSFKKETINNEEHKLYPFSITESDPNVFIKLKTINAQNVKDDLDITLYEIINNEKFEIASSGNEDSNESIYMDTLQPGNYELEVFACNTAPTTTFDLGMLLVNTSQGEGSISLSNKEMELNRDIKNVKIQMKMPNSTGKNIGFVYAVDEANNFLGKVKITAESHDKMFIVDTTSLPSQVKLGEKAKLTINATNKNNELKNIVLLVGLFEKNTNKLIKLEKNTNIILPKSKENLDIELDVPKQGNYIIRCFVWDDLSSMNPLSKMKEINVIK